MYMKNKTYKVKDYIGIPLAIAPIMTVSLLILRIIMALMPSFQVLATSKFIDTAIEVFKNRNVSRVYITLMLMIIVMLIGLIATTLYSFVKLKIEVKINEVIRPEVALKRNKLEYRHIENNETWDLISRVGEDPSDRILKGFYNLLNVGEYVVKISGLMIIIVTQAWWVAMIISIISIPLFMLSMKSGELNYKAFEESDKYLRKAKYLREVLSSREAVEERTLFGYSKAINNMWDERFEAARKIEYKAQKINFIRTHTAAGITAIISIGIAFVLIFPVKNGQVTPGMYMSLTSATFALVKEMSWKLSYTMQEFMKSKIYLKDLTEFCKLREIEGSEEVPNLDIRNMDFHSIEFRNVHFAYPGTSKKVLNGLSMKLYNNKKYAFVGKNGAGKTTITKLLTGLYNNYEGEILINGRKLKTFTQAQLKGIFSVVYQDFARYEVSIKDNIMLGNCSGNSFSDEKDMVACSALKELEINEEIEKLPKGIETKLGKLDKDALDLSGGQWQKIAIGRSVVSESLVNILDEPTAALDPISESNIYKLFAKASKSKPVILITHRLGAARIADEILLIEDGIISEKGTHEELMKSQGEYAEMFNAQRGWYHEG